MPKPQISYKYLKGINKIKRIITPPAPERIKRLNFAVTYHCNSRCKTCSIWKKYRQDSSQATQELSLDQIKRFFNGARCFDNLDEINLTGGEPFSRRDFQEIYQYLRHRFPRTTIVIVTNGLTIMDGWIVGKEDILWSVLIFSLDGLEKTNDAIRGVKGSYQRVIKAVNHYKKIFPALKLGLSFTILPDNYHELRKIYKLSCEMDLSFTMRFASMSGTYYSNSGIKLAWTEEMLNKAQLAIQSVINDLAHSRKRLYRLLNPDLFFFSKMVSYKKDERRLFRCHSGTHSLFLDPYGNVHACIFSEKPLGNIVDTPFDRIWFSEETRQKRGSIARAECHCWTECETIPSLQRNLGDIIRTGKRLKNQ
ncbi:MAG: radical SAM protein [Calditrichia bacterium]